MHAPWVLAIGRVVLYTFLFCFCVGSAALDRLSRRPASTLQQAPGLPAYFWYRLLTCCTCHIFFFVFVCLAPTIVIPLAPPAYGSVSIARTGEVGPNSKHALRVLATAILTFDHALWRLAPWFALESLPLSFLDPKTLVRRVLLLRSLHFSPRCCHVGVVLWRESTVSFLTPLSDVVIGYA